MGVPTWMRAAIEVLAIFAFMQWLCDCGGAEFTVEPPWRDAGATPATLGPDGAGAGDDAQAAAGDDAGAVLEHDRDVYTPPPLPETDAGDVRDAGDVVDAPAVLEHDSEPPPPAALCCVTPCSGSAPAAITCGNGPAWTCSAGSCSDRACAVGATCMWMSVCSGHVAVCP